MQIDCEKHPVHARGGMIVANHPRAASVGADILLAGGNAVDAAVATLLALCVVEPMMVGITGGGVAHLRTPDGTHHIYDGLSCAGASMLPDLYEPVGPDCMDAKGARNRCGASAVAVPGNLAAWAAMHERHGSLPWADLVAPAATLAGRGFSATPYLAGAVSDLQSDLMRDATLARVFYPNGTPIAAGARVVQPEACETLQTIGREGAAALYDGTLGDAFIAGLRNAASPGVLTKADLQTYRGRLREAVRGRYRGFEIVGPPPPASSGVHIVQMLNMLSLDAPQPFASAAQSARLLDALRAAFADRRATSGDPDFVDVPVERLMSPEHAALCRNRGAGAQSPTPYESRDTTHVTIADKNGMVVSATHTINGSFGARFTIPGTGIIPNNYMANFDPNPGRALSVAPGKRVPTSMAPMMILAGGEIVWALGLPGGTRIFPSAFQAIVNLIDHRMDLQSAIEAPRLWTDGGAIELEPGLAHLSGTEAFAQARVLPHVGGGMNAIAFDADRGMTGAACWRADGTVIGLGGGQARPGIRFWPDQAPLMAGKTAS